MKLTKIQIKKAKRNYQKRVRELRRWYEDNHPLIKWNLQQVEKLSNKKTG